MTPKETIHALLTGGAQAAEEEAHATARKAARVAWVEETMAALKATQDKVTQAWDRIFDALPEDLDEEEIEAIPEPPEQAELDALHAQIDAVCKHDKWPRELHFKDV